jgi:hypothetical protein
MKTKKLLILLLLALLGTSLIASVAFPTQQNVAYVEVLPEIQQENNNAEPLEELNALLYKATLLDEYFYSATTFGDTSFNKQCVIKQRYRPPIQRV